MEDKYQFAQEIVLTAGEFLRQHLEDDLEIQEKSDFTDLVTQLDWKVQQDLTESILQRYPEDTIVGEESENRLPIQKGKVWVIDPIDGTTNFIVQKADFAILLAYFEDGVGKFGLIYDVMQDKLYHGGGDFPVYENGTLLASFQDRSLRQGLVGINAGLYAQNYAGLADLANQSLGTRSFGSAGISFSHVLTGRLLLVASYLFPWDYAAAGILGEKLGYCLITTAGLVPSYEGREYVLFAPKAKLEEIKGYLR